MFFPVLFFLLSSLLYQLNRVPILIPISPLSFYQNNWFLFAVFNLHSIHGIYAHTRIFGVWRDFLAPTFLLRWKHKRGSHSHSPQCWQRRNKWRLLFQVLFAISPIFPCVYCVYIHFITLMHKCLWIMPWLSTWIHGNNNSRKKSFYITDYWPLNVLTLHFIANDEHGYGEHDDDSKFRCLCCSCSCCCCYRCNGYFIYTTRQAKHVFVPFCCCCTA